METFVNRLQSKSMFKVQLRYYATFKVRKFESLFCKVDACLHKTTTYIGLRAE